MMAYWGNSKKLEKTRVPKWFMRCMKPCRRKDSVTRGSPIPVDHRCIFRRNHKGDCSFISTCSVYDTVLPPAMVGPHPTGTGEINGNGVGI